MGPADICTHCNPLTPQVERVFDNIVEGSTARGTTALVYLQLHISLYTGTVHVLSRVAGVHPTSLTVD
jgi:hypothetical protein